MIGYKTIKTTLLHLIMIMVVFICLYPLFIMVAGSFKSAGELASNPAGFPSVVSFINYTRLMNFNAGIITRTFFNSIYISCTYTLISLLLSSLAAFAFAKYEFRLKEAIFIGILITMMIPGELLMPPLYLMFSKIRWLNTYKVLILPGTANVFALFMLRQYISQIPNSLLEAARMDGAGHLCLYKNIIVPVASPALGALAILVFLGKWNDYLYPKIMIMNEKYLPIMVMLPILSEKHSIFSIPWELVLTGCVIVTTPLIVIFLLFQEKFMSSVAIGAVKE
ncbi:MAG: carbohydrate ABC transporter permease [Firmicutes bacterium]|nr:carbohydrate ABC transporter permease [Bacillota bacterium]